MKTPTLREIAAVAGVHHSTLSRALNNHQGIPLERRLALQALAKKMGYVRDPILGALMAYRTGKRPKKFQAMIGWLTPDLSSINWRRHKAYADYFKGAADHARELGFGLEEIPLIANDGNAARITGILAARNIQNLIVGPATTLEMRLDKIKWERFSAVRIGYSLSSPQLHLVTANHFAAMVKVLEEVHGRGYRRPGLFLTSLMDERIAQRWSSPFLRNQLELPEGDRIPPYLGDEYSEEAFLAWFDATRPDVIIAPSDGMIIPVLEKKRKLRVPEDIGFAGLVPPNDPSNRTTGIKENNLMIGAAAVDLVIAMFHRRELGVPSAYQTTLIENGWLEGGTLRARMPVAKSRK